MDNNEKNENNANENDNDSSSVTDSCSSYVIEEEIVEYEISDSEENVSTKKSQKLSEITDKEQQASFFNTALQMKEEEMKNKQENANSLKNNEIPQPRALKSIRDEFIGSFKNVSDSMENIKTRFSNTHLDDDSYNKVNFNRTDNEFRRDIKRIRFINSKINETQNNLKKALYNMKGNPFSIPDDELYNDLPSEIDSEIFERAEEKFNEDKIFMDDEEEVIKKYILCVDEDNKDVFAEHYENLYKVDELFRCIIFPNETSQNSFDGEQKERKKEIAT